jgi:hypothetical protein
MANYRLTFFFEQFDQLMLFFNQVVDFGGFMVEEFAIFCSE